MERFQTKQNIFARKGSSQAANSIREEFNDH